MKTIAWAALAALLLAGCAAPVLKLPSESPVTVTVLSDARQSESGIGDYLLPGSQVYVGGRTLDTGIGGSLAMKFNAIVVEALRTEPANAPTRGPKLRLARANDRDAAIELEPLAHFWRDKSDAYLLFLLNANFDVAGVRGRLNRITYAHGGGLARPFSEWASQGGASFRASAQRAFVRMTDVFKADLRGELPRDSASLKRVRWQPSDSKEPQSGFVLYEQPDYVAIIPVTGDREPRRNATFIIDRSQLRGE